MKTFLRILLAPLIWILHACSPLGKPVDIELSDNFYYNKSKTDVIYSSMGNWFELGKSPLGADASTFQVLNHHIGKDKDRAYYREHTITYPDLDLDSFRASNESWMWHIGMDKNKVYALGHDVIDGEWQLLFQVVEGADPSSFLQYDSYWAKDASRHFYDYQEIPVDYGSFELINDTFAKDSNKIYLHYQGQFITVEGDAKSFRKLDRYHACDATHVFYYQDYLRGEKVGELKSVPIKDLSSIQVVEQYYLLADDKVYYKGKKLQSANRSNIEVLSELYAKDDQHVYYQDLLIEEADAATFHYDQKSYCYRDKNHRYEEDRIWSEKKEKDNQLNVLPTNQKELNIMEDQSANDFQVDMQLNKETYHKGEEIAVKFRVKNTGEQAANFCQYHTPFEGIKNNLFTIIHKGTEIPYQGMMKRRVPPTSKDYKEVQPGKNLECKVILSGYELQKRGQYSIQFSGNMISGLPASNIVLFEII